MHESTAPRRDKGSANLLIGDEEQEPSLDELETVVVYGGLATPPIWKVSKDDHVLWVVGNRRAPAGSTWRMDELDARIAESKLALFPGTAYANPDVSILKALTLIRSFFKAAKNPDGQTLEDVLPAESYARWSALKTIYAKRDKDLEEWRPSIALSMLEEKIVDELRPRDARPPSGPALGPALLPLVEKSAKKKRVRTRTMPKVVKKAEAKNIRAILKGAQTLSLVDEQCVADYLDHLDHVVDYWKQRASGGEGAEPPRRPPNCNEGDMYIRKVRAGEMPDSLGFVKLLDDLAAQDKLAHEELDAEWMVAAQAALKKNPSTVAVLQMANVKGDRSYIDKLRQLGYSVEEPPGVQ